ncbi:hypothetical protein JQ625_05020 [Bradyrhizobium diazoefficiens]|nr:hypothetical protein [Bradyrhizobium diazoefficiens]MBR0774187.1 hypothetical protein [Bradyrhizobium diazoefficiens]
MAMTLDGSPKGQQATWLRLKDVRSSPRDVKQYKKARYQNQVDAVQHFVNDSIGLWEAPLGSSSNAKRRHSEPNENA